ncbi:hypothetical protein RA265_28130, partial [Pseudomonas syringae pv. tagetis]|uniref:hypothetical protein n=1 Tax=Pseudomonas syringae group genomosp. 7 TaxID=251699 RepID=UPI00376F6C9B
FGLGFFCVWFWVVVILLCVGFVVFVFGLDVLFGRVLVYGRLCAFVLWVFWVVSVFMGWSAARSFVVMSMRSMMQPIPMCRIVKTKMVRVRVLP